ncbi:MAG TPA: glycosyltransferase family 39 protein [Candidatus Sulfotelmatobacter sp.]|jgi:4-amino-4-deoxy-L-arabinose transferase-like glycosyltransferase|nr:glycosyltransferase family 39 protein [Candidatus Sulfotelmatobacter sp.]
MFRIIGGFRPYLLLTLLCLALYLPGLASVPPIDRDESRFAQASHQMLESGDYIRIQFQDEIRAKKPAGIYWLQAGSARLFGAESKIWAYRLPSAIGALLAVLLTFHFGQYLFGRPAAVMGAALLACALILVTEAHQAKTDAVQLACVAAAQGVLGRLYMAGRNAGKQPPLWEILLFWVAIGFGILVKGPIVPMVSLLTVIALWIADRRIGWLRGIRPITGIVVAAAIVAPWAAAISHATEGQFIGQAVKQDLLPKLLGSQESHGALPGYYLLLATALLWPGSLFVVPGFVRAVKLRSGASLRFCLAWIVPTWLVFELVPTKLPHYVLPAFPALALLAGIAIAADDEMLRSRWARGYAAFWALVGIALAVLAVAAPIRLGEGFEPISLVPALAALGATALPAALFWKGRHQAALSAALLGALLTFAGIFQGVMPDLDRMFLSRRIAESLAPNTPVAAAGFHEPSLVFLMGTKTRLTDGKGAADFILQTPHGVAVIEAEARPAFETAMAEAGRHANAVMQVDGFNYSRGRPAALTVFELEGTP